MLTVICWVVGVYFGIGVLLWIIHFPYFMHYEVNLMDRREAGTWVAGILICLILAVFWPILLKYFFHHFHLWRKAVLEEAKKLI